MNTKSKLMHPASHSYIVGGLVKIPKKNTWRAPERKSAAHINRHDFRNCAVGLNAKIRRLEILRRDAMLLVFIPRCPKRIHCRWIDQIRAAQNHGVRIGSRPV